MSAWLDHPVEFVRADPAAPSEYEIAIQTVDEIEAGVDQLTADAAGFPCGPGGFFDAAPLHLLTDATLAALGREHADGRFDVRRFRPNLMIAAGDVTGPVEAGWVGHTVAVGDEARVSVLMTAIRCVMTTLPQEDLPRDPKILRTIAQSHEGNAGVYALVEAPGRVNVGDALKLVAG
jgi:MOSC domain-containing protein